MIFTKSSFGFNLLGGAFLLSKFIVLFILFLFSFFLLYFVILWELLSTNLILNFFFFISSFSFNQNKLTKLILKKWRKKKKNRYFVFYLEEGETYFSSKLIE